MSLWSDTGRLKGLAVAVLVAFVAGFGVGATRYRNRMPAKW